MIDGVSLPVVLKVHTVTVQSLNLRKIRHLDTMTTCCQTNFIKEDAAYFS